MGKRVTLRDVAEAAGCTTATVSYVLNDAPGQRITPETRERVRAAARMLRYTPNSAARTLRRRRTGCVGVVIKKNLAVPRFSQTLRGIQSRLEDEGYTILLCGNKVNATGYTDYISAYLERRIDGIIFMGKDNQGPDEESRGVIAQEHIPFVAFDCQEEADAYSTVDYDYRGGARLLTARLLAANPARVLYVQPAMDTAQERLREEGVRQACAKTGTAVVACRVPITLDNLETWDLRYSVGATDAGDDLTAAYLAALTKGLAQLADGDAAVLSWATWSESIRLLCPDRRLVVGELANNGESRFNADFCTHLPNFAAGVDCGSELLALLAGGAPTARVIKLTDIGEHRRAWTA